MKELIPVESQKVEGKTVQAVDARKLYNFLGPGRKFNAWILGRIEEYGFKQGIDYVKTGSLIGPNLKRLEVDYFLTLDMAKEVAMVERNEKGQEARRYFIAIEKEYREMKTPQSWLAARNEGKAVRKITTDILKTFIEYAKAQGSQSAEKYYMNFSKMVNDALLEIEGKKPENLRDQLNVMQLHQLSVGEQIISKSLIECMAQSRFYKDIFQIAKQRIQIYASSVGRSKLGASEKQTLGILGA